ENGALTATAYNSLQLGSIRARADYYFLDEGLVLPYGSANIGFGWSTFESSAADIVVYDNQESVVLGAEAGALFNFAPSSPYLLLAGRYSIQPSAEFLDTSDIQTITIQLGIVAH
ncbi:MAG TPA: hypothetical protein VF103_14255, partial [Polyangiaceae bacterium]